MNVKINAAVFGAPERTRTHNLLIRSQVLYPIELQVHSRSIKNTKEYAIRELILNQ